MQLCNWFHYTKMTFFIKDFFSKCDQIRSFPTIWSYLLKKSLTLLAPGGGEGEEWYHRGIFLSRTLERQMILNWNFVTFNIFLWWIKCWKSFFRKNLPNVMTVLSRASDDIFTYSFCVVNFIGNYVKISL